MAVRAGGAEDPASRIERLVQLQERRFRRVFLEAVRQIRDSRTLDEIADLLSAGRLEEALDAVEAAARLLGNAYGAALAESAQDTAAFLSQALTVSVSFDVTNSRAVAAIQRNTLRLVSNFTSEQRQVLRAALSRGISQGLNPRDQARLFREVVGLTPKQEAAVARYRQLLESVGTDVPGGTEALTRRLRDRRFDPTVRRAARRNEPLTKEQVDRMVGRYKDRYVRYRSEVIARTEALRSAHEGTEEMYSQAIEQGQLDPSKIRRTWVATKDDRVRDTHAALGGVEKPYGEPWESNGAVLRYPGDPQAPASETVQCRCVLSTRLDE